MNPSPNLPERELHEGQLLLGKYRIRCKVGEGGFGRVYDADDLDHQRRVALKVGRTPRHEERMEREARLAGALRSPYSVRVFGIEYLEDGSPVIVMELLHGVSLREYLAMRGQVEPSLALVWAHQMAEVLRDAHAMGLVHRDLKPSNLFLVGDDAGSERVKLLDFGLARPPGSSGEFSVTGSDIVLGSPAYMAPEQIRFGEATERSDVWSFGIVLYEMLAGRRPFRAEMNTGLLAAIAADQPEPLHSACPGLPAGIYHLVDRCLCKTPADRLAAMTAVLQALDDLQLTPPAQLSSLAATSVSETLSISRPKVSPARRPKTGLLVGGLVAAGLILWAIWNSPSLGSAASEEPTPVAPPRAESPGAPTAAPVQHKPPPPAPQAIAPPTAPSPAAATPEAAPRSGPQPRAAPTDPNQLPSQPGARGAPTRPPATPSPDPTFFAEPDF